LGEWYAQKFENKEMDAFFKESQAYIDTIGKNGNDATNMELYGATNMDSIRHVLQLQHDSAQTLQMKAVTNTSFNFYSDSLVVISFDGRMDTSKWRFVGEQKLEMEELTGSSKGSKTEIEVLQLTKSELKLKIEQEKTFSTVTFGRDKK
jgi:hypothetical protein